MMEYYRLVGVINLFGLYPDFLFPVYERGNEYFFHNGSENQIECFDRVKDSITENIIFFKDTDCPIINMCRSQLYYKEGKPAYAFQDENKIIFCSDLGVMLMYLDSYQTEDVYVKEAIYEFILENKSFFKEKRDFLPIKNYINSRLSTVMEKQYQHNTWKENPITTISFPFGERKRNFDVWALKRINNDNVDEHDKKNMYGVQLISGKYDMDMQELNGGINFSHYIHPRYSHSLGVMSLLLEQLDIYQSIKSVNEVLAYRDLVRDRDLIYYFNKMLLQFSIDSESYRLCIECIYAIIHQDKEKLWSLLREHQDIFSGIYGNRM
ncbi:MAG: hypothetical protein HDQ99_04965 [Lachnospiraceae bacterium]|nr:hypothetical protein [Lachnospiraceae bacterium]